MAIHKDASSMIILGIIGFVILIDIMAIILLFYTDGQLEELSKAETSICPQIMCNTGVPAMRYNTGSQKCERSQ